jgi:transposase
MDLIDQGWLVKDVANALGMTRKSVSEWKKAVAEGGRQALRAKPQHVPECRLSKLQQAKLKRLLRAGPRKSGFGPDLWTLGRVAELVEREFGVPHHPRQLGRLLHALGFSCQKPQRRSREQDPEAVNTWREKQWPAIKKGRRRSS